MEVTIIIQPFSKQTLGPQWTKQTQLWEQVLDKQITELIFRITACMGVCKYKEQHEENEIVTFWALMQGK